MECSEKLVGWSLVWHGIFANNHNFHLTWFCPLIIPPKILLLIHHRLPCRWLGPWFLIERIFSKRRFQSWGDICPCSQCVPVLHFVSLFSNESWWIQRGIVSRCRRWAHKCGFIRHTYTYLTRCTCQCGPRLGWYRPDSLSTLVFVEHKGENFWFVCDGRRAWRWTVPGRDYVLRRTIEQRWCFSVYCAVG